MRAQRRQESAKSTCWDRLVGSRPGPRPSVPINRRGLIATTAGATAVPVAGRPNRKQCRDDQPTSRSAQMGNSTSASNKPYRVESFANDPTAFRVFVKKRNKFIPGWLKVGEDEIGFIRNGSAPQFWPLAFLRRYGYTCAGIFFFESGRRCASGEGLHTFQSHQAERIFQVVQGMIRSEELRTSRASSVVSSRMNAANASAKIHPVQRFHSEGSGASPFIQPQPTAIRRTPNFANGSVLHSVSSTNVHAIRDRGDRPRSVVSALEYEVGRMQKPPVANIMNASYTSQLNGSCWSSQQQLEGEIVNEHILGATTNIRRPMLQPQPLPIRPTPVRQLPPPVGTLNRKYHSYVNVDFGGEPPQRPAYREMSAELPKFGGAPPLMSQSMSAFEPHGEFPAIDERRIPPANMAAAALRPIPIPQRPPQPPPLEYFPVPIAQQRSQIPRSTTPLANGKIRISASQRSDCGSTISAAPSAISTASAPEQQRRLNYARIDFHKTKALEQFANVKARAAEKLRHNGFIRRS